jgi:hypothetical protein
MGTDRVKSRALPLWLRVLRVALLCVVVPVALPLRLAMAVWEILLNAFVIIGQAFIVAWRGGDL